MLVAWAQDALEVRVGLGEQAAEAVADPGRLAGGVVVEAHDHLQLGDRLILKGEGAQGVGFELAVSAYSCGEDVLE